MKYSKQEFPLKQHTSIEWPVALTIASLGFTSIFFVPFCLLLIGNYDIETSIIVLCSCGSFLGFSALSVTIFFIFKNSKTQLAANDDIIIIKNGKEYLEFDIKKVNNVMLLYNYSFSKGPRDETGYPSDYYNNYGKIRISLTDGDFYIVKGHNLNKTANLIEKFTGLKAEKIKKTSCKTF